MLEKIAFKILGIIASMVIEGENLVVEKREILALVGTDMTPEELDSNMEALEINDMIAIRYSDANLYCVALKPKGKLVSEKNRQAEIAAATETKENAEVNFDEEEPQATSAIKETINLRKLFLVCASSSFAGGLVAAIIAFLIARFG